MNRTDPFGLCDKPGEPKCHGLLQNLGQFFKNVGAGAECGLNGNCSNTAPGSLGDAVGKYVGGFAFIMRMGITSEGSEYLDPKVERQRLSPGEIKQLKKAGLDPEELKEFDGKADLFKDKEGNIFVHPKNGSGPGDPTGYNIRHLPKPPDK